MVCGVELFNSFYHCIGCEKLIGKDFDICHGCFQAKKFKVNKNMSPALKDETKNSDKKQRLSYISHKGKKFRNKKGNCGCRQTSCRLCGFCCSCSCVCHLEFERKQRFFASDTLKKLQEKCKKQFKDFSSSKSAPTG